MRQPERQPEVEALIERAMRSKDTHLDLESYQLTTLPKSLASLTNLTQLNLDLALLDDLSILQNIPNLSTVTFRKTSFPRRYWTKISEWQSIWLIDEYNYKCRHLLVQKFGLDRMFTDIANNISYPFELNLNDCNLFQLPENISNLTNLTALDISHNNLTVLPESIGEIASLISIDASNNQLTSIPDSISKLGNLIDLDLGDNRLEKLPDSIGNIQGLNHLCLRSNKLTILPETIGNLTNLITIDIEDNQVYKIPNSIGNLIELEWKLYLSDNNLTLLPESIGNLVGISILFLDGNKLTALPENIGNLTNLVELNLEDNQLKSLPKSIGNLTNLVELYLGDNQLKFLPESIGNLTNLVELYLEGNQLESLPKSIANLSSLAHIDLTNNPLDDDLSILQSLPQLETVVFLGVELSDSRYWTKLSDWKPQWLLDEENVEIRRMLIQHFGYESICHELDAIELDTWREYTLLKIDAEVDVEPMVLLKMTCPSTAHIHILRVPPEMMSAESAITWVNHGIHPDKFAMQT